MDKDANEKKVEKDLQMDSTPVYEDDTSLSEFYVDSSDTAVLASFENTESLQLYFWYERRKSFTITGPSPGPHRGVTGTSPGPSPGPSPGRHRESRSRHRARHRDLQHLVTGPEKFQLREKTGPVTGPVTGKRQN